jgi:hypothetical protein
MIRFPSCHLFPEREQPALDYANLYLQALCPQHVQIRLAPRNLRFQLDKGYLGELFGLFTRCCLPLL